MPQPKLPQIIQQAEATANKITSKALEPNQHICVHGTDEVIVWEFAASGNAFHKKVYGLPNPSPAQLAQLRALSDECDVIWRTDLIKRAQANPQPERTLDFQLNAEEAWEAKVGRGSITLIPKAKGIQFISSFGPNSENSFTGYMPGCNLDDAKQYVYSRCLRSLPWRYGGDPAY
jgi:hypothetical protein